MFCTLTGTGQKVKTWRLHLQDDSRFEGPEHFRLQLSNPVMAALQLPVVSMVTIWDPEDGTQFNKTT